MDRHWTAAVVPGQSTPVEVLSQLETGRAIWDPSPDKMEGWNPLEWQAYVNRLLAVRHGEGGYQPVPDRTQGDHGIEGFTYDGIAYQCYAKTEPSSPAERLTGLRDKITEDVGKFIKNRVELEKLLGDVKIARWVLLTPRFDDKSTIKHASKKTKELRAAKLPYATDDIAVVVQTDDAFPIEKRRLVEARLRELDIWPEEPTEPQVATWRDGNISLVSKLEGKASRIPFLRTPASQQAFTAKMLRAYLRAESFLDRLRANYPEEYHMVLRSRQARARDLEAQSLLGLNEPGATVVRVKEQFAGELFDSVQILDRARATDVAWGAVADWLLQCPLDFPGEAE